MAVLRVLLNGIEVGAHPLQASVECLIGRDEICSVKLEHEAMSRRHLKLVYKSGTWHLEKISKFGKVFYNNEPIQTLELKPGMAFTIPPYAFVLTEESSESMPAFQGVSSSTATQGESSNPMLGALSNPNSNSNANRNSNANINSSSNPGSNSISNPISNPNVNNPSSPYAKSNANSNSNPISNSQLNIPDSVNPDFALPDDPLNLAANFNSDGVHPFNAINSSNQKDINNQKGVNNQNNFGTPEGSTGPNDINNQKNSLGPASSSNANNYRNTVPTYSAPGSGGVNLNALDNSSEGGPVYDPQPANSSNQYSDPNQPGYSPSALGNSSENSSGESSSSDKTFVVSPNSENSGNPDEANINFDQSTPYLRVAPPNGEEVLFKLKGNSWTAGRIQTCQIQIDDTECSRQHFNIFRKENYFYVMDLNSSNGTLLNGHPLSPNVPSELNSGDTLQVGETLFFFEIRDPKFDQQVAQLNPNLYNEAADIEIDLEPQGGNPSYAGQDPNQGQHFNERHLIPYHEGAHPTNSEGASGQGHPLAHSQNHMPSAHPGFDANGKPNAYPAPYQNGEMNQYPPNFNQGYSPQFDPYLLNNSKGSRKNKSKKKSSSGLRLLIVGLAGVFVYFALFDDKKGTSTSNHDDPNKLGQSSKDPFLVLTSDQKQIVETSYNLGTNLYRRGNYTAALREFEKVAEFISSYKNTKEMINLCHEGIDRANSRHQIELEQMKEKKLKAEIRSNLQKCSLLAKSSPPISSLENCLAHVLELEPDNETAKQIIETARSSEEKKRRDLAAIHNQQEKVKLGEDLFKKAEEIRAKGNLQKAIVAYQDHINSSYPDPKNLKSKSTDQISQIRQTISGQIKSLLNEAQSLLANNSLKEAYTTAGKALAIEPNDEKTRIFRDKIEKDLKKSMKLIYSDSVIEENIGNIEAAKQKWKKIVDTDIPSGEYFKKAKIKLSKYGSD